MSGLLLQGGPSNPQTPLGPLNPSIAERAARTALLFSTSLPECQVDSYGSLWLLSAAAPQSPQDEAILVIGAFDGVHRGHKQLMSQAKQDADARNLPLVVVTFAPDPDEAIPGVVPAKRLLMHEDRMRHIAALEPDAIWVLNFNDALRTSTPQEFVNNYLLRYMSPVAIHVGKDFRFGSKNAGTVETLRELGEQVGFSVCPANLLLHNGHPITATWIRTLLAEAQLTCAWELLGRPHFVRGRVERGRGEGTKMGFPTANVACHERLCMSAEGVYAGFVLIENCLWPAAINVGAPPSFSGPRASFLEANIIGFEGNIYESELAVVFIEWLRAAQTFSSREQLERVVMANINWTAKYLGRHGLVMT